MPVPVSVSMLSSRLLLLILLAGFLLSLGDPAWSQAAGGLDRVNTFVDNILTVLRGISVSVATISFLYAGYKFLFRSADLAEIAYILFGGLLVGGAAELARFVLGNGA